MIIRWPYDEGLLSVIGDQRLTGLTSEILRSHRVGNHLLVLDRKTAECLLKLELSGDDRALLGRLRGEFTQTGALYKNANIHLEIVNSFAKICDSAAATVHMSLGCIASTSVLDPPLLLVENINTDGWLYEQIFGSIETSTGHKRLRFETFHGGGEDIVNVLQVIVGRRRVIVAIADSDKDTPISRERRKTLRLHDLVEKTDWPLVVAAFPPCRELENLIPMDVIFRLPSGVACRSNDVYLRISKAEQDSGAHPSDLFFSYADIKKGICAQSVQLMPDSEKEWVVEKIQYGGLTGGDWSLQGYGDRVIPQIRDGGRCISDLRAHLRSRAWREIFQEFFSGISWYFVSSGKLIT